MNKKNTGSYYTPSYLASFITKRVLTHFSDRKRISILEPSVGDGAFVKELYKSNDLNIDLTALDINEIELVKACKKWHKKKGIFKKVDFLNYSTDRQYSIVIGNPPYVKKNVLTQKQISSCKEIHAKENLSESSVKNIWATFIIKSNKLLHKNGVLAFVLPSELLQVKFAEEIRKYLKQEFQRIEIFTFNDLMFECKGQDTIVLFAYKKSIERGEFFVNISSKELLIKNDFVLKSNNLLVDSKLKWTHHYLTREELIFIEELKAKLMTVNHYTNSKPGIVTAANKFFIIDKETEKKYKLKKYTKPIIQKGLFVNGSVVFNEEDIRLLEINMRPTRLLQLNENDKISYGLKEYLKLGENQEIPTRYKCRIRKKWYVIPNISRKPDAFFFKRSHLYPKLLKNDSQAFVTDSAYKIEMKDNYDLNSFVYSFYNTFTLLVSELYGRYYGGGVLELIPSEFKKLPIPYINISREEFNVFDNEFKSKKNIEEILLKNDFKILNKSLGISKKDIYKLNEIRRKLISKRMKY